jgi:hypothetical protein
MTSTSERAPTRKGMRIATRCTSVDQFVDMFHRFVDEDSFFVSTVNTRPAGLETSFSVQLADGTPVLSGLCTVLQSWTTTTSPFKTPGVRLGIKRLTASSMSVFERLLVTRSRPALPLQRSEAGLARGRAAPSSAPSSGRSGALPPPAPSASSGSRATQGAEVTSELDAPLFSDTAATTAVSPALRALVAEQPARAPGSDVVLPANPLMDLTDASLEGYVDCTLYEETGTFFLVDDNGVPVDELLPPPAPPLLAPRPITRAATPVEIVEDELLVAPSTAPVPMLGGELAGVPHGVRSVPVPEMRAPLSAGEVADIERSPRMRRWLVLATGVAAVAGLVVVVSSLSSQAARGASTPSHKTEVTAAAGTSATNGRDEHPARSQERDERSFAGVLDVTGKPHTETDVEVDPEAKQATPRNPKNGSEPDPKAAIAGSGPCTLVVEATPAGSIVHLDDVPVGPSPITLATSCTRHKIELKHPRYQNATKFVVLKEGAPQSLVTSLHRPTHALTVTSQPQGATVYIDGRRAGTTPTALNVMGFSTIRLEIKKSGYAPVSQSLYSKVPQDKVDVKLTKW